MFNRGRFNLARFNLLTSQEEDIFLEARMVATVQAMTTNGQNIYETVFLSAHTASQINGAAGVLFAAAWPAVVSQRSGAELNLAVVASMDEALSGQAALGLDSYPTWAWGESIAGWAYLGGDYYPETAMAATVEGWAWPSADHYATAQMNALWWAQATTMRMDQKYIFLDVSLPPGSTLVIDSDNYVVLLDGQEVMWAHKGDWLWLNRRTFDVTMRANAGALTLEKKILYTEKWK